MQKETATPSQKAAFEFLCKNNPFQMPQEMYVDHLNNFSEKHGEAALEGLAGFILFIREDNTYNEGTKKIASLFKHDLQGAGTDLFEPKSSYYAKVWAKHADSWEERRLTVAEVMSDRDPCSDLEDDD